MLYDFWRIKKVFVCILVFLEIFLISSCWKNDSIPNYNGIDEFAEYVNDHATIDPLYWSIDLDKDSNIANILIYIEGKKPYSDIDSIRTSANSFLQDNPDYFLNEYLIRIFVTSDKEHGLNYAKFSNSEDMLIPAFEDDGKPVYDSLCSIEVLISEEDLEYISSLDDIVSIRFHPANPNETLMIGCCETVSSMDCLTDVYVVGNWYDYFEDSDLECTVHDWTWN